MDKRDEAFQAAKSALSSSQVHTYYDPALSVNLHLHMDWALSLCISTQTVLNV